MMYIIGFIIVLILISTILSSSKNTNVKDEINKQEKLKELINKNVEVISKEYINKEFTESIVLDETNKKIHLLNSLNDRCVTYNFNELIESEIIINNESITKFNRGNQVIGSVVGGLIAGVPGMIIGGLSSPTITSESIKDVTLKLTFNDMNNPICKFNFLDKTVTKDSHEYKIAMNFIERWYGYFTIILKQQNNIVSN